MKIERKVIDKNVLRVTTSDERWYFKNNIYYPSSTWIASFYPKNIAYVKWVASHGYDEATLIAKEAAEKGSIVHKACELLSQGKIIKHDTKFTNPETGELQEISAEEYYCALTFVRWFEEFKPKIVATEMTVFNDKYFYAGTLDLIAEIDGKLYLIDLKTSKDIWPSHEIQIASYLHADHKFQTAIPAILQVGYGRNKKGFKFTIIKDKFNEFLAAKTIWANECSNIRPLQREYPLSLKINGNKNNKDNRE